jgi:hypothetical protein
VQAVFEGKQKEPERLKKEKVMDLQQLTVSQHEARRIYLEYRDAKQANSRADDAVIKRVYRHLAKSAKVISLSQTFLAGGVDGQGRPRLAVVRADARWCRWQPSNIKGSGGFMSDDARPDRKRIGVPAIPGIGSRKRYDYSDWKAIVPLIPPRHRPGSSLSGYHLLWEAEWDEAPPIDPALLKHLGGDFYLVLAVWDLTKVEQLALLGR